MALHHLPSRTYYHRKCDEGNRHNQALIALARPPSDVLYAMPRDGTSTKNPNHETNPQPLDENL